MRATAIIAFGMVTAIQSAVSADIDLPVAFDDLLFVEGEYDNPRFTVDAGEVTQAHAIGTEGLSFFSGHVAEAPTPETVPSGTPSDGSVFLVQSALGTPTAGTAGYPGAEQDLFAEGNTALDAVRSLADGYYAVEDPVGADPEDVYLAIGVDPASNTLIDPVTGAEIFVSDILQDTDRLRESMRSLFIANRVNPLNFEIVEALFDIPYYQSVGFIILGNLELEKAFSVRFREVGGFQMGLIGSELELLGWDLSANPERFDSADDTAFSRFNSASQVWLAIFRSPVLRDLMIDV